jgi:hypothetical protein
MSSHYCTAKLNKEMIGQTTPKAASQPHCPNQASNVRGHSLLCKPLSTVRQASWIAFFAFCMVVCAIGSL